MGSCRPLVVLLLSAAAFGVLTGILSLFSLSASGEAGASGENPVSLVHVNPNGSDFTGNPCCPDAIWADGEPVVNPGHDCNNITSQNHVIRGEGFDNGTMSPISWNIDNSSGATATAVVGSPDLAQCALIAEVTSRPNWNPANDDEWCLVIHSSTPGETRVTFTYLDVLLDTEFVTDPVVKEWGSLIDTVILKEEPPPPGNGNNGPK